MSLSIDLNRVGAKGAIAEEAEGKWGMVIDQDICTGCQACVAACAMENNLPFVMEEDAGYGRTMHWIRIERFWEGEYPEVHTGFQPMLCQQCGNAPCEPVCPVFATVHSQSDQINRKCITAVSARVTAPTTVLIKCALSTGAITHSNPSTPTMWMGRWSTRFITSSTRMSLFAAVG